MKKGTPKSTIIALGILLVGVVIFALLIALRPEPPKVERPRVSPMVTTVPAVPRHGHLTVTGTGTVRPTREVNLGAEVAGKVIALSPVMVSGGVFRKGDVLVQLDTTDYVNAVSIADAEVTQRRYELLQAREERDIAAREWTRLEARTGEKPPAPQSDLGSMVLKEPQLKLAEAMLKSAEARLSDARTRLARTHIRAPFGGRVRTKNVELGQYVAPGQVVAALFSTESAEIAVPLSSENAALITGLWGRNPATHTSAFPPLFTPVSAGGSTRGRAWLIVPRARSTPAHGPSMWSLKYRARTGPMRLIRPFSWGRSRALKFRGANWRITSPFRGPPCAKETSSGSSKATGCECVPSRWPRPSTTVHSSETGSTAGSRSS